MKHTTYLDTWSDPALAWPANVRGPLPGPAGMYATFTAWSAASRAEPPRCRGTCPGGQPATAPATPDRPSKHAGAIWATGRELRLLTVLGLEHVHADPRARAASTSPTRPAFPSPDRGFTTSHGAPVPDPASPRPGGGRRARRAAGLERRLGRKTEWAFKHLHRRRDREQHQRGAARVVWREREGGRR